MSLKGKWGIVLCNGESFGTFIIRMGIASSFTHAGLLFPDEVTGCPMVFDIAFRPFHKKENRQDGCKIRTLANFKETYSGTFRIYTFPTKSTKSEELMYRKIESLCRSVTNYSRDPFRTFASYFFLPRDPPDPPAPLEESAHMFCSKGIVIILRAGGMLNKEADSNYVHPTELLDLVDGLQLVR